MRQRIQPWSSRQDLNVEISDEFVLVKMSPNPDLCLLEVIKYCPGKLTNDRNNLLLLMKVLVAISLLHQRRLPHLGLTLDNIFIGENYECSIGVPDLTLLSKHPVGDYESNSALEEQQTDLGKQQNELGYMAKLWCIRKITNFDYLMFLNRLAGRKLGDPSNSAVLPWVTSFSSPEGELRDLTKSKYHLAKGEDQLNANFKAHWTEISSLGPLCSTSSESLVDAGISHLWEVLDCTQDNPLSNKAGRGTVQSADLMALQPVRLSNPSGECQPRTDSRPTDETPKHLLFQPHHLLDMMPNLAYYTYTARRTPKQTLMQYVRPIYQPHEFPSTMARLYESTPEECIPEFFTDPTVFKSIHPDMPDLAVPAWCSTPEDFIAYHRSVLESEAVSSMLHHWIDLTFGYKLIGEAAVAAKNVHLEMAGSQTTFRRSGVTCLFRTPHPHRLPLTLIDRYFGPTCPFLDRSKSLTESQDHNPPYQPDTQKPLNSMNNQDSFTGDFGYLLRSTDVAIRFRSLSSPQLHLPSEYNPLAMIEMYEELCRFLATETPLPLTLELPKKPAKHKRSVSLRSLLNFDVEAIGCLTVELFTHLMVNYSEAQRWTHTQRLQMARSNARRYWDRIPSCLHNALRMILDPFDELGSLNTFQRRFLPTARQLLLVVFEFPPYMYDVCTVQQWLTDLASSCESALPRRFSRLWGPICAAFFLPSDQDNLPSVYSYHVPPEVLDLLNPHLQKAVQACPWWLYGLLQSDRLLRFYTAVGGLKAVDKYLLPLIMDLYKPEIMKDLARRYTSQHPVSVLCSRRVLQCLLTHMTPTSFLSHLPACLVMGMLWATNITNTASPVLEEQLNVCFEQRSSDPISVSLKYNRDFRSTERMIEDSSPSLSSLDYPPHTFRPSNLPGDVDEIGLDLRSLEADCELLELFQGPTESEHCPPPSLNGPHSSRNIQSVAGADVKPSTECRKTSVHKDWQSLTDLEPPVTIGMAENDVGSLPPSTLDNVHTSSTGADLATSVKSRNSFVPPVAVATGSVIWLARRIGPILTARHVVPHLLAAIAVAYSGEQLMATVTPVTSAPAQPGASGKSHLPMSVQVTNRPLMGDSVAAASLRCLENLVHVYGVCLALHVYIPYAQRTVNTVLATVGSPAWKAPEDEQPSVANPCSSVPPSRWNVRTLGELVASLTLLHQFLAYIPDLTLSDYLRDSTLQDILHKSIRISGRLDSPFPCGSVGRLAVLYRVIDCIYVVGMRVGFEMTRTHMTSLFQVFFALFDRVAALNEQEKTRMPSRETTIEQSNNESSCTTGDFESIGDTGTDQFPSAPSNDLPPKLNPDVLMELCATFTNDLARLAYIPFCCLAGGAFVDTCIYNTGWIQELVRSQPVSQQHGSAHQLLLATQPPLQDGPVNPGNTTPPIQQAANVIQDLNLGRGGPRGDFTCSNFHLFLGQRAKVTLSALCFLPIISSIPCIHLSFLRRDVVRTVVLWSPLGERQLTKGALSFAYSLAGSVFHGDAAYRLRGSWSDVFQQITHDEDALRCGSVHYHGFRLASFAGHNGRINSIDLMSMENGFVTASQDRTVQLWSLSDSYSTAHPSARSPLTNAPGAFKSLSSATAFTGGTSGLQGFLTQTSSGRDTPNDQTNTPMVPVAARLVYRGHKRPVFKAVYLDNYRLMASCDGHLILWDPWTGQKLTFLTNFTEKCNPRNHPYPQNLVVWAFQVRGISGGHSSHLSALTRCCRPHGALFCAEVNGTVRMIDPRTPHSSQMSNPLQFFSGSFLAGLRKDHSRVPTTYIPSEQNSSVHNFSLQSVHENCPQWMVVIHVQHISRPIETASRDKIEHMILYNEMLLFTVHPCNSIQFYPADLVTPRLAALTAALRGPTNFLSSQTPSNPTVLPPPSNAGTLTRLAVCDGANVLLCGFTSGFLTAVDLRQFQVIQAWQAHSDAIVQLGCTTTDWFVSSGDRSLAFWHMNSDLHIDCIRTLDHVFARCSTTTPEENATNSGVAESSAAFPVGISSVSQFACCKDELLVCGPTFAPTASVSGLAPSPNELYPRQASNYSTASTTVGVDLLGVYRPATQGHFSYQPLGRIPSHLLRGRVTTLSSLSLSGLFLVGSHTGA
ncbi:Beige/BEACH domain protein, partial [Opisthorchis viverrini]